MGGGLLLLLSGYAALVVLFVIGVIVLSLVDLDAYASLTARVNPVMPRLLASMLWAEALALVVLAGGWLGRARGAATRAWGIGRATALTVAVVLLAGLALAHVLPHPAP